MSSWKRGSERKADEVALDQKEQALSELERAYAEHDLQMQFLDDEPAFK